MDAKIWTTKAVSEFNDSYEQGYDPKQLGGSPYHMNMYGWRVGDLLFKYTREEFEEILKCKKDILYFADKYAYAMTDEGVAKITLRPYQKKVLKAFKDNRFNIYLASRQVGKCSLLTSTVTIKHTDTGIIEDVYLYELWYKLFKNINKFNLAFHIKYFLYKLYAKLEKLEPDV